MGARKSCRIPHSFKVVQLLGKSFLFYKDHQSLPCPSVSVVVPVPSLLCCCLSLSLWGNRWREAEAFSYHRSRFLSFTGSMCLCVIPEDFQRGYIWAGSRKGIDGLVTVSRRACRRAQAIKQCRKAHTHTHTHKHSFQGCWKNPLPCWQFYLKDAVCQLTLYDVTLWYDTVQYNSFMILHIQSRHIMNVVTAVQCIDKCCMNINPEHTEYLWDMGIHKAQCAGGAAVSSLWRFFLPRAAPLRRYTGCANLWLVEVVQAVHGLTGQVQKAFAHKNTATFSACFSSSKT